MVCIAAELIKSKFWPLGKVEYPKHTNKQANIFLNKTMWHEIPDTHVLLKAKCVLIGSMIK